MAVFLRGLTTRTYSLMCKHTQKLRKHNCKYCLCRTIHMSVIRNKYEEVFRESIQKPEEFWGKAAENLIWHKRWEKVLDNSDPPFTKWFVGGEMNTCYNALDRYEDTIRADQVAIIHDSPVTNSITRLTYRQLLQEVRLLAGVLTKHGVKKGDRVVIYMPMIPEAVISMLATARIGAIHSLVFGGFSSKELSVRINHAEPKVVISANCGVEPKRIVPYKPMLDGALQLSEFQPSRCIIFNRPKFEPSPLKPDRDVCWQEEMAGAKPVDCVPIGAMDPLYLLYTSGTTGLPKAVVRPSGGHAVALYWSMYNVYGMKPGDVWWAASDLGWVVGHSYIAYGPLLHGNTSILFEGKPVGTPDSSTYFRVIQEHKVNGMFTAPTAIRAIRAEDPEGILAQKYELNNSTNNPNCFKALFVAGEHCDHETLEWIRNIIKKPVLDNWWQTETGWPITSTCYGLNMDLFPPSGVTGRPVPGWDVKVMDSEGKETAVGDLGDVYVKLPLPPGSFSTLWNAEEQFLNTYFTRMKGYYDTKDAGILHEKGYISVLSRSDDVINVAGHRLSAGAIEEAILECDEVVEAAVIGVPDKLKGQIPLGLCVIKHDSKISQEDIMKMVMEAVRQFIGPVAAFKQAIIVPKLPKTRSGKVPRSTLTAMACGKPYEIPVTIEDASVFPAISEALQKLGYGARK